MRVSTKKLLSINLVLLMMLSLIVCPFFTQKVEAEETSKFEEILIVDGKEYDAKSHLTTKTWEYSYNEDYDLVKVCLHGYNGGSIYCSKRLVVSAEDDSIIESFDKPAIECKENLEIKSCFEDKKVACDLKIISHNGNNAVKSDKNITVDANCEIISENAPALLSGVAYINDWVSYDAIEYVGDNEQDAKVGKYINQNYLKIDFNEFTININGNGVKTKDGDSSISDIYNIDSYVGIKLTKFSDLYSSHSKEQLGWTTSLDKDNKEILLMNDNLFRSNFSDSEVTLYPVWTKSDDVILKLYNVVKGKSIENIKYLLKKGDNFEFPETKYAGCELVNWHNQDETIVYNDGDKVKVNSDMEFFPKFEPKKCIIGGSEVYLKFMQSGIYSSSYILENDIDKLVLNLYGNYSGAPINLPDDAVVKILSQVKIESEDELPPLTVDGDLYIETGVNSGLEVIAQDSCKAISCSGDFKTSSNVFVVGDNNDNAKYTDEYNGESYFKVIKNDCWVCRNGEVVLPEIPKYSKVNNTVFLGWKQDLGNSWYKPEQDKINSESFVSVHSVYKPCEDFAVRLYGNGGINKEKEDFSVWYDNSQSEVTISDFEFSREGCSLKSWNTKEDGTGINYDLNSCIKKEDCKNEDGIIDLYAIWDESLSSSINYKVDSEEDEVNVNFDEDTENKIIKNVTKNSLENIDINILNKAELYNIKLSKNVIDSIKSNCSVTFKTNISNIIIPKKSLLDVDDEINISIKKLEENKIQINTNITKDIKIELDTDKENSLLKINHNEESLILPKLIKENNKLQFIVSNMDNVIEIVDKNVQFEDNKDKNEWYYDAVQFVGNRDLFTVKDNKFEPNKKVVRSELVSILHRLESKPEANKCDFKDVKNEDVFAEAVAWASSNNIVKGTLKGFEPDKEITREQLCVMIYNYAKYLGLDTNIENIELTFDDNDKVASWSIDAVKWMVEKELLKGSYNKINPRGNTTNAQLATIVKRFVEMIVNGVK